MRTPLLALLIVLAGCLGQGPGSTEAPVLPDPGPPLDRVLTPDGASASEVSIATNPTDPAHVVAAANSDGGFGVYWSHDAGSHWNATYVAPGDVDPAPTGNGRFLSLSDPVVAFAPDGTPYLAGLAYLPTSTVFVTHSPDGGATWEPGTIVHESDVAASFNDKEWLAIGPTTGTMLVSWQKEPAMDQLRSVETETGLDVDVGEIVMARSTDGGQRWSEPQTISRGLHSNGTQVAFAPDGTAHAIWVNYEANTIDHATSTDDGRTWTDPAPIASVDTVPPYPRYQRMHTLPGLATSPVGDELYVVWHDGRFGDADVLAVSSADGGQTWSDEVRVTRDDPDNGVLQLYPWVTVDPLGRVHVTFYDSRPDPSHPRFGYYHAVANGTALAFAPATPVSSETFTAFEGPGGDPSEHRSLGDYTGVAASSRGLFPAWADGRGEASQVWAAHLPLASPESGG